MLCRLLSLLLPLLLLAPVARAVAPPDVVVSVKPLHALVAGVMRGVGEPRLLVRGGASPHVFTLRPSDAQALAAADLVIWSGGAVETFLERPLTTLATGAVVMNLQQVPGLHLLPVRAGGVWEAHDRMHEHDKPQAGGTAMDGHIWLDPLNAKIITDAVAASLARLDPDRASIYRANAATQDRQIDALHAELAAGLAPVKDRPFIVFHDAFHYLEDRYGLNGAGAITVSPEQPPGAARMAELRQRIRGAEAVCIFAEPQFEPALVRTLADGTNARTGMLDPEGASLAEGPDLYAALLRFNMRSLVDCLSGN